MDLIGLKEILWNFSIGKIYSKERFEDELIKYNELIKNEEFRIDLSDVIINNEKVVI